MQLRLIPREYPRIENMQSIIDMIVSSFLAIGEGDSVKYYLGIYRGMFPNLDFDKFGIDSPSIPNKKISRGQLDKEPRPYVIQIGAFGSIQNENRLKLQVTQIGYEVEIVPVQTNGRGLNAVRVVRFRSKSSAERVGSNIKKKLGLDYRVLYRPVDSN